MRSIIFNITSTNSNQPSLKAASSLNAQSTPNQCTHQTSGKFIDFATKSIVGFRVSRTRLYKKVSLILDILRKDILDLSLVNHKGVSFLSNILLLTWN
ncbi:unnamed protein product [Arabidopsis halleri]